jgi:hypothetical protein
VNHWSLYDAYLELLDDCLDCGGCCACKSDHELRGCVHTGSWDLDEQLLSATQYSDGCIVARGDLQKSLYLVCEGVGVGNYIIIKLASLDLPAASGYLSSL